MKKLESILRVINTVLLLLMVLMFATSSEHEAPDTVDRLTTLSRDLRFNFFTWEVDALWAKFKYGLLTPHRYMSDAMQSEFLMQYLDYIDRAQQLERELNRIFVDPDVEDPQKASEDQQLELASLRVRIADTSLMAEAILSEQVSAVLVEGGFGGLPAILPPVLGTFTPLPYILIVSPRDSIESFYQQQLIAGLTAADQDRLESQIKARFPDYTAYTTAIGGLAAYPAMLQESSVLDWVPDVMAHEWVHHYLMFAPLGWQYMASGEARTINETTASLIGEWAGQEVILRFYAPLLSGDKGLPDSITPGAEAGSQSPPAAEFNYNSEMRRTRVNVDRLLSEGKIKEAEWYMEAQRRYFVANGYNIRVLNQAYFAFHGAYADTPGGSGAAGKDPLGPAVRELWSTSETPRDFVRLIGPLTSLSALRAQLPN